MGGRGAAELRRQQGVKMRSERERLDRIEKMVDELEMKFRELRDDMDLMMAVIRKAKEAGAAEAPKAAAGRKKNVKSAE